MNTLKHGELFRHLSGFLKSKGIELKDGSYSRRIQQGCQLLSDAVNATQRAARRAKFEVDKKVNQLRERIHGTTASKARSKGRASSRRTGTRRKSARASASSSRKARPSRK